MGPSPGRSYGRGPPALAGPIVVRTDAVAFLPDKGGALTVGVEGGGAGLVVRRAIDRQEDGGEEQD